MHRRQAANTLKLSKKCAEGTHRSITGKCVKGFNWG